MDNEFDIDILDESIEEAPRVQLPMNFLELGQIQNDDVKIYIKQDVYKALEKLAASDTSKELGSILLGQYCQEYGRTHVIISQFIEAKYTDASAATLTFTHDTWDYVHKEHARRFPGLKIIGWQHTHPNYGIFLSNYDMFIQENFFNLPFQIAYVIDPIQNLRGFFQWKNGHIEKLKGYYIYDDLSKPIKIEQTRVKKETKPSRVVYGLLALLCAATLLLSFFTISLNGKYETLLRQQRQQQEEILADLSKQQQDIQAQSGQIAQQNAQMESQSQVIQTQADIIAKLQALLASHILDDDGKATAAELLDMLETGQLALENQADIIAKLQALLAEEPEKEEAVNFISYTVVAGDTLSQICANHGLDYGANYQIILSMNGITNPNHIYVGQVLLLPISE